MTVETTGLSIKQSGPGIVPVLTVETTGLDMGLTGLVIVSYF